MEQEEITKALGSMDEYKMFVESTERVTDRRINLNRSNYTTCIAILTGIAVTGSWGLNNGDDNIKILITIAIFFISLASILLCLGWLLQISDLKNLNNAKFTMIKQMTTELIFIDTNENRISSFEPYDKEWKFIENKKGLINLFGKKVLLGSTVEYLMPIALILLFSLITSFSLYDLFNRQPLEWII